MHNLRRQLENVWGMHSFQNSLNFAQNSWARSLEDHHPKSSLSALSFQYQNEKHWLIQGVSPKTFYSSKVSKDLYHHYLVINEGNAIWWWLTPWFLSAFTLPKPLQAFRWNCIIFCMYIKIGLLWRFLEGIAFK